MQRTCLLEALFVSVWIVLLRAHGVYLQKFYPAITLRVSVTSTCRDARAPPCMPRSSSCPCSSSLGALCTWQWELHASVRFKFCDGDVLVAFKWHCQRTCIVRFQSTVLLLYGLLRSMQRLLSCSAWLFVLAGAEQARKIFQHQAMTEYEPSICNPTSCHTPNQITWGQCRLGRTACSS